MRTAGVAVACTMLVGLAYAADQQVLGKKLSVIDTGHDPSLDTKRRILIVGKDRGQTIVGNPVVTGATVTVTLDGGTPTSQTFDLLPGVPGLSLWSDVGASGMKYRSDTSNGYGGPVRSLIAKRYANGKF